MILAHRLPLSRASLSYSPSTSFHRRIVHQCAAFLGLQTSTGEAKAIVVRLPTELYALTRFVLPASYAVGSCVPPANVSARTTARPTG
jgi:hypothetical protein